MPSRFVIFLVLNFGALAIGGLLMGDGPKSDWYEKLSKAPWTPPGWLFGVAWPTIMLCFSLYLAFLWPKVYNKTLLVGLYALQWFLNVSFNPAFFNYHLLLGGLIIIIALTFLIGFILWFYWSALKAKSLLLLPYFLWLLVAISLNGYVFLYN